MRTSFRAALLALLGLLALIPAVALGHELFDHQTVPSNTAAVPITGFMSGGDGAKWEAVASLPTGNPHTDIDFFTKNGETFASVGTLAAGGSGGQTIVQLTRDRGATVTPSVVGNHPSASCVSNPSAALGLQHDVEATPKGTTGLNQNTANPFADPTEAKLLVDATDANGRCHDQGVAGLSMTKQGGLEFIDISDPTKPVEIGLTSHAGEAHTVNIDPKRPHIAYVSSSDSVTVTDGRRTNTTGGNALDGIEVVDFRTCLAATSLPTLQAKRDACRPEVYRYRYPSLDMAQGHTNRGSIFGCHELEVYPNDRITCAGGAALIVLDARDAFDDAGTPTVFTDDKPRGTPLGCRLRDSSTTLPEFKTGAMVTDCVDGTREGPNDLIVANWLQDGAPSWTGVEHVGSVFHAGREGTGETQPDYDSTEDIDFNHEAEYTHSGNFLFASDERGGGVLPPGASCDNADNIKIGNGGLHFYRADGLLKSTPTVRRPDGTIDAPASAAQAFSSYAKTKDGEKAIYRAKIRTGAEASTCTVHVFQQIPGQNRIFMGYYSQGTQVLDFVERPDGTIEFKDAGYFIPPEANTWVSHVFKAQENPDGTFTYWGATGDFAIGDNGRNAIDVYKVTLPAPPKPADGPGVVSRGTPAAAPAAPPAPQAPAQPRPAATTPTTPTDAGAPRCVEGRSLRSVTARGVGRRLRLGFSAGGPVTVDLFQQSQGRTITGERLVVRFRSRRAGVTFNGLRGRGGRRIRDGYYVARFTLRRAGQAPEFRRVALVRRRGRFSVLAAYDRRDTCTTLRTFKLERPVFGGRTNRPLNIAFRVGESAQVGVTVQRGSRVVKTFATRTYQPGRTQRLRLSVTRRLGRGAYRVTIRVTRAGRTTTETLTTRRI
jgi:hypothetical protein